MIFEYLTYRVGRINNRAVVFCGSMIKQTQISKRELKTSLLLIALMIGIIALSSLLLVTQYWFIWPAIIVCILVTIGYFVASKGSYQCPTCRKSFKITKLEDFFALHGITKTSNGQLYEWKLLRCPGCSKREKCYRVSD
jgi:fatty-acid desaturase